jgi:hypothetical protein
MPISAAALSAMYSQETDEQPVTLLTIHDPDKLDASPWPFRICDQSDDITKFGTGSIATNIDFKDSLDPTVASGEGYATPPSGNPFSSNDATLNAMGAWLRVNITGSDSQLISGTFSAFDPAKFTHVRLRCRRVKSSVEYSSDWSGSIYWDSDDGSTTWLGPNSITQPTEMTYSGSGEWVTLVWDLSSVSDWISPPSTSPPYQIRFDLFQNATGVEWEVDWMQIDDNSGDVYQASRFDIIYPDQTAGGQTSQVRLAIVGPSDEILQPLRKVVSSPEVDVELVLASSPSTILRVWSGLRLKNIQADRLGVSFEFEFDELSLKPFPPDRFSYALYPGLYS